MTPLVFLDLDGVLNSRAWLASQVGVPRTECCSVRVDPQACLRLQAVCATTGAALVISSSWRILHTVAEIQAVLAQRGLTAPILGRTPSLGHLVKDFEDPWNTIGRGLEIQWWLQHYIPTDDAVCAQRFAILDDDRDMGALLGKLVQTRYQTGLGDLECDYLHKHLRESLLDSMAAGGKGRVLFKYDTKDLRPWWNTQEGPFGPGE